MSENKSLDDARVVENPEEFLKLLRGDVFEHDWVTVGFPLRHISGGCRFDFTTENRGFSREEMPMDAKKRPLGLEKATQKEPISEYIHTGC
jgi:hypothetical protein